MTVCTLSRRMLRRRCRSQRYKLSPLLTLHHINVTLARQWLMQMGEAATLNGNTIQYCMSHVRHILQVGCEHGKFKTNLSTSPTHP